MWRKWQTWSFLEGISKTIGAIFQYIAGSVMKIPVMGCLAGIGIGTIQMLGGLTGFIVQSRTSKAVPLIPTQPALVWPILTGISAGLFGTVGSIYTFTLGGGEHLGLRTLLINCAIIFGAIIGRVFWSDPLRLRHVLGLAAFLSAVWAMTDFHDLGPLLLEPAPWMVLTVIVGASNACNEAFTRASSSMFNEWTNAFWMGIATMAACTVALFFFPLVTGDYTLELSTLFLIGVCGMGFVVLGMFIFRILAYKGKAPIIGKKAVMMTTYLVAMTFVELLPPFNKSFTVGKGLGLILFVPVVILLAKEKEWKELWGQFNLNKP